MPRPPVFEKSVFINCPFDDGYQPLLRAIVFSVLSCGFSARSAIEENDSGEVRLDKIKRLIKESRLGIHDISRTEADVTSGLPRFNMPFELGLDLGARAFGSRQLARKKILIFDRDQYRYQQFLSDIAGQDISAHAECVTNVMSKVRGWLNNCQSSGRPLLGADAIEASFIRFTAELPHMCEELHLDATKLDFGDFVYFAGVWSEQMA
ncbi:hypothetical protein NHH73_26595 [Oxalobacteraceae bacterium OTU3CINTB1]|nr:hypothetical protein NHH73_26595 [Oxalobacteraceae bacterium OTU3CINTB1]